jgi:hypothetical protein
VWLRRLIRYADLLGMRYPSRTMMFTSRATGFWMKSYERLGNLSRNGCFNRSPRSQFGSRSRVAMRCWLHHVVLYAEARWCLSLERAVKSPNFSQVRQRGRTDRLKDTLVSFLELR